MPLPLVLKKPRRGETISSPLPTPVIPGEFFRDSIRTLHEDPFIPTQLRVSSFLTLTTVLPLDNLTYLDLSHNDWVTFIPREVLRCTSLRKLDISGCTGLMDGRLPGCLAELRGLEWLAADGCDIIAIDLEISTLPKLHTLSLMYNRLDYLPSHLSRLHPHLKLLSLQGNPCYSSLLPRRKSYFSTSISLAPPSLPNPQFTSTRPQLNRLQSLPRLRHAKSTPNLHRTKSRLFGKSPIDTPIPKPPYTPSPSLSINPPVSQQSDTRIETRSESRETRKSIFKFPTLNFPRRASRQEPSTLQEMVKHTSELVIGGVSGFTYEGAGEGQGYIDSSEESDCASSLESGLNGSFASSVSSPGGGREEGVAREEVVDQSKLTVCVLSKLRDLWELSNGCVCFEDGYENVKKVVQVDNVDCENSAELDEEVEALRIQSGEGSEMEGEGEIKEKAEGTADVIKRVMGVSDVKRAKIIKEIVETEETYIRGLEELVEIYIDNNTPPLPPSDECKIVFRHVKMLHNFHKTHFLPSLQAATTLPPSPFPSQISSQCDSLGTVFSSSADFMKMYFEYINNFDEAIRTVEKWQTSKPDSPAHRFLKMRIMDERHSQLNLLGYLLLPVQRVPRYRLLLADLVKASMEGGATSGNGFLVQGYDKIEALAREINERKAEMEGRKRLVDLERTVIRPPVTPPIGEETKSLSVCATTKFVDPARRLVKEENLYVIVRRKKGPGGLCLENFLEQKCLAVSCSDKLFLCAGSTPELSLLADIPLENSIATRCWEAPSEWRLLVFDEAEEIVGGECWRFKCDKEEDVLLWLDAIAKATRRLDRR